MKRHAIEVKNLTVTYGVGYAVREVSCRVPEASICAIVGPNGAGKTTLIKALLQLITPLAGVVSFFGSSYQDVRDSIAYVPQRRTVDWDFPVSVLDVVLMGRYKKIGWFRRPSHDDHEKALQALRDVKLSGYEDRHISELSGGERQRVFLARALVQNADLYIMDEPFVGVDALTEKTIVQVLKRLRQEGKTIVVVHHDLQTLQEYFDWMILLNKEVVAYGPLEEVFTKDMIQNAYGALPPFFMMNMK